MKKAYYIVRFFSALLIYASQLCADVVIMQDGKIVTGEVLQHDDQGVLIKLDYGTFRYPELWVKDVRKEEDADAVEYAATNGIPHWGAIISRLAKSPWAHDLKQIPATVIDTGIFKEVPYVSFRCATSGYEVNIYGDLDRPAGIEIGTLNYLLHDNAAKSNCIEFISKVLTRPEDAQIIRALKWNQKALIETNGTTFELTLPEEADAYGGWWVSVYNRKALENAQASGRELLAITEPRTPPPRTIQPAPIARPVTWSPEEIEISRVPKYSESTGNAGGRVFVRGYYRKNGTYVHSYTRRSPRRH